MLAVTAAKQFEIKPSSNKITAPNDSLSTGLSLMEDGRWELADGMFTIATLARPRDSRAWLAAGICRMRRGRFPAARAAFQMSAWLDGNPVARDLLALAEHSPSR